jgi:hypothetical protein
MLSPPSSTAVERLRIRLISVVTALMLAMELPLTHQATPTSLV